MIRVLTIESELSSVERLKFGDVLLECNLVSDYPDDLIIRWGNSSSVYESEEDIDNPNAKSEFKYVINSSKAITLNCYKNKALQVLSTVVDTPQIWIEGSEVPEGKTAVHRYVHHHSGHGFNVQTGPFVVKGQCYATSWIPSKKEYRVWFCGDNTMCGIRTVRTPCQDKYPCRSMWGYTFQSNVPAKLHKDTLIAAKAIGLECGAADVLEYKGKYYFLELNSAPTIDKQVIEDFYRKSLALLIKKKYPRFK